jgi:hypothetical protein
MARREFGLSVAERREKTLQRVGLGEPRPLRVVCDDCGVNRVVAGTDGHGLILGNVVRGPEGDIWSLGAEVVDAGLRAELTVTSNYAVGFDDLAGFFAGMAKNWRGWDGERVYESIEHELRITGRHLGSRVHLAVELDQTAVGDGWRARATFTVDAGEQLSAIADDFAALLG